jgi:hypothetical protein
VPDERVARPGVLPRWRCRSLRLRRDHSVRGGLLIGQSVAAFGLEEVAGLGEFSQRRLALARPIPVAAAISPAVLGPSLSASRIFARV